ncbi:MAG TPA: HNH endonuclease signature motif containing protein [Actinomycetota bacterium]|nr:HNH endonuclease signature motif containing protein [Actinomycetota bacterium]
MDAWARRARTRRGIVASVVAVIVATSALSPSAAETGEAAAPFPSLVAGAVVALVVAWWSAWWLLGWFRNSWERHTHPATPAFAKPQQTQSSRTQLRHDANADIFKDRGFMFRKRFWFVGTGCPPVEISPERLSSLARAEDPVPLAFFGTRTWWYFEGEFYWENEGYDAQDVKALLRQRERQKQRKLEHARALLDVGEGPPVRKREGIPQDVRLEVWRRDGGRCAECGRDELLEYDHIIPIALGGSNTAKNLQLLCADCNRAKGAHI